MQALTQSRYFPSSAAMGMNSRSYPRSFQSQMLECNVFGLKETKKNGSLSCEVVDLRKIRAISGVSRAKITRKSIVHCYRPLRPEAFLEKVQV